MEPFSSVKEISLKVVSYIGFVPDEYKFFKAAFLC